ncbi:MAG: D-2-hydroxyacid dehydrogenase [Megasphaera sp.]|jgi:phosphoglycerate dehydrogenase-like enzyme|nr:D-2-hydroxyacid dehydrogenase [Megasphaera sp.]
MKIIVAMETNQQHRKWLEAAAGENEIIYLQPKGPVEVQVPDSILTEADVIIGNIAPSLLSKAVHLQWLQLNSAGANSYCRPGILADGVYLTNATGAYGLALAEHMTGQLLAMMKKLYVYYDNQKKGYWHDEGTVQSIYGAQVLIIGFGDIGRQFGKRMKAMGAHVTGIRRRSTVLVPEADEMGTMDELDTYLARADIVASCLPDTAATYHLYTSERFAAMKRGAYFLNIGRGSNVVQKDLCNAVKGGHLAGAAVDVTDPEPLPDGDLMWHTKGIYITPHVSGGYHLQATHDNIIHIAAANLRNFLAGKPLRNLVDFSTGYKK